MSSKGYHEDQDVTFRSLFLPLTTKKVIYFIIIIGFIVFGNMLFNGFVWDDITYVLPNSAAYGLDLLKQFGSNYFNTLGYYRPVPAVYFSFIYSIANVTPFLYHFIQLILHLATTILLFLFISKMISKNLSLLISLIFLVHPMQVESVSYIAQTGSVLYLLLGLAALLINDKKLIPLKHIVLIFTLVLFSMLTKESGIIFLPLLIIYRYLFHKGKLGIFTLGSICTILVYLFIRFIIGNTYFYKMSFVPIAELSFSERLLNIPAIFSYYLSTFLFPAKLAIMQNWTVTELALNSFFLPLAGSILFIVIVIFCGWVLRKKKKLLPAYIFFTVWFFLGIAPSLQITPLNQTVSDRWFYLPLAGLLGMFGILFYSIIQDNKFFKKSYIYLLILIVVCLSLRTLVRNTDWHDAMTLYSRDVKVIASYNLEANLAHEYSARHEYEKAKVHFKNSIALLPSDNTYSKLGAMYERTGDLKEAKKYYDISFKTKPPVTTVSHSALVYENAARYAIYFDKNPKEAIKIIRDGLTEYPENYNLWIYRVITSYQLNDHEDKLYAAQKAYELLPNSQVYELYTSAKENRAINIPLTHFYW